MSANDNQGKSTVTIKVDGQDVEIHRGRQTVADIKNIAKVNPNDVLALVVAGQPLQDLPSDGAVTIKGGEIFVSHVPDGGSS